MVIENGCRPPAAVIEDAGVYQITRLSLHRSIDIVATVKCNFAFDERAVDRQAEILQTDEAQVLTDVNFDTVVVGAFSVDIGINEISASGYGISPFYMPERTRNTQV